MMTRFKKFSVVGFTVVVISFLALAVLGAEPGRSTGKSRTNKLERLEGHATAKEDGAIGLYFSRFGDDHQPASEVNTRVTDWGVGAVQLLELVTDEVIVDVYWTVDFGPDVYVNDTLMEDLFIDNSDPGKVLFFGATELVGWVTTSDDGALITQLSINDQIYRARTSLDDEEIGGVAGGEFEMKVPEGGFCGANCGCFGKGPATGNCPKDSDCDNGIKCGKNRACRWQLASEVNCL